MTQPRIGRKGWKDPLKNLMTLEAPGQALLFDADRAFVQEVSSRFNLKSLVLGLIGRDEARARQAFGQFGREVMGLAIELADGKYLDRTGEMVEKVYRQTGVSFPHRFERYVELCLLGCRPLDRWNITKATTDELWLEVSTCAVLQHLREAGLNYPGLPCQALDLASFEVAAAKTGDALKVSLTQTLPKDGLCRFSFLLQQG